ncbi:MAG: agmatine deiminase family protein [Planctomycetes bacterium]|nr:agmatine deiminase family protein [Planctomycetota bacterium]
MNPAPAPPVDPERSAASQGFTMPAEWSPLEAVWLVRPHNEETWPGCLDQAQAEWEAWKSAMEKVVRVRTTDELGIKTNDSWIRDFGPVFVKDKVGRVAAHSFVFNGWGGKYETRSLDDAVPDAMQRELGLPMWRHPFVLEGGSIDSNGAGTLLTTRQCLENQNRNPGSKTADIEQQLRDALGVTNIVWLPGGIEGDDTDGHVDDVTRFVRRDAIAAVRTEAGHPDHAMLEANWKALELARDEQRQRFELLEIPAPQPLHYDFPADRFGPGGRRMLPASHANFLFANGVIFVPAFGGPSDDVACRMLENATGFRAQPVMARSLVVGLGSLHCLSCQQPQAKS